MFTAQEQQLIIDKVNEFEAKTSSNIHIHVRKKCQKDALKDAQTFFMRHKMDQTQHRNAVLIFIGETSKRFAIIGDKAIHEKVQQAFWDNSRNVLVEHFKQGDFLGGLIAVVEEIGPRLVKHFPKCDSHDHDDEQNKLGDLSQD